MAKMKNFGHRLHANVVKRDGRCLVIVRREFVVFGIVLSAGEWKQLPGRKLSRVEALKVAAGINLTNKLPIPIGEES